MEYKARLKAQKGRLVTFELTDDLDIEMVKQNAVNEKYYATIDFYEKDTITDLQRSHFYALVGDINEYTGTPMDAIEDYLKYNFMLEESLTDFPSLGRNRMKKTMASKLLEYTINYCISNEIPFRKQTFYLTMDTNKMLFALTMKRICWVCGRPGSDIHHLNGSTVGMGNNRNKVNHVGRFVTCLCRAHHNEIHTKGEEKFLLDNHFKGIKLTEKMAIELGMMSKKQIQKLEEITNE